MFGRSETGGPSWILVCLGNPGDEYENTRHNVGFMVADELAERQNAPVQKLKFKPSPTSSPSPGRRCW